MEKVRTEIILIGPPSAGKSTLGELLATELGLPQVSLDKLRWDYYCEIGFDDTLAKEIRQKGGFVAIAVYWSLFNSYAIERILTQHHDCVFDFGAGPIVFENDMMKAQISRAFKPFVNVVYLLPSPNLDKSVGVIQERNQHNQDATAQEFDWSTYFVKSEVNRQLAKYEVYTEGKTPTETCFEILTLVQT